MYLLCYISPLCILCIGLSNKLISIEPCRWHRYIKKCSKVSKANLGVITGTTSEGVEVADGGGGVWGRGCAMKGHMDGTVYNYR